MTREEKATAIKDLTAQLAENNIVYLADISGLNADTTSKLRRACFKGGIKLAVVKNTFLAKAMEASERDFADLPEVLKGNTSVMFAEVANAPAKIIKEFRKKSDKPILKGAYINEEIYVGGNELEGLAALKSKEEVIGEIIMLLKSPAQKVIAALQNREDSEAQTAEETATQE